MKYEELTYKVIGCAMEVHKRLGGGFREVIYQRALAMELKLNGIPFEREKVMDIHYRDTIIGRRRVDFFVDDKVMVELKAFVRMENGHLNQAMNYLEVSHQEIGLLLNFGGRSLEYKRIHNNDLDSHDSHD